MSRLVLIFFVCLSAFAAGVTAWMLVVPDGSPPLGLAAPPISSVTDEERQERRENFFGGDADRDVRGGREMRPRW